MSPSTGVSKWGQPSSPSPFSPDHVVDEQSPLGDYMDEVERSFDSSLGSPLAMAMDFDATIRRPKRPSRSSSVSPLPWTAKRNSGAVEDGLQDDDGPQAGPSRMSISPRTPPAVADNDFSERFKYLVATSGLLERTLLSTVSTPPQVFPSTDDDTAASQSITNDEDAPHDRSLAEMLLRWDILAALAALVVALAVALGIRAALIPTTAIITGMVLYWRNQAQIPPPPSVQDEDEDEPATETDAPQPEQCERDRIVHDLEELLSESRGLDQSIAAALKILAPRPDDPEQAHELRIALHRLFDDMTDSLAGATSTLTPMADRGELTTLCEMYDVQVTGAKRRRGTSSSDEEDCSIRRRPRASSSVVPSLSPDVLRTALLSPHERAMVRTPRRGMASGSASPFDANDKFTKLPERRHKRASWSTDWSTRSPAFRSGHEPRLDDEAGTDMSMSSTDSSAFLRSIPDDKSIDSPPSSSKSPSPYTPKRASPLAQALARLETPERRPGNPHISLHKAPASQSPFRRSLQDIPYIPSTPTSNQEKAANLAIARASASMSTDKRRSLQIPANGGPPMFDFAREQVLMASGANLARARSLDNSGRARLHRPRPLTPASRSKRHINRSVDVPVSPGLKRLSLLSDRGGQLSASSANTPRRMSSLGAERPQFAELGLGVSPLRPPRAPARVPSVSPLTLGGLKAACFGVHLKRRRMACCLLGLHFNEPLDSDYWEHVSQILRDLSSAMSAARSRIDVLRTDAEREATAASVMSSMYRAAPITPPPSGRSTFGTDFAPRDTAEQAAIANIDEVQRTLARVWARCEDIRAAVMASEDVAAAWADVRVDIGGMLRHVDRGRAATDVDSSTDEEHIQTILPDFVRAWNEPEEPGPGPEEIERLVDEDEDDDDDASLPPPGLDQVFEGIAASAARQRSTLSREERIALTREARVRGLTFAQLTAKGDPEKAAEAEREIQAKALREASGQMVAELEGVFGAVRRRKGMEA